MEKMLVFEDYTLINESESIITDKQTNEIIFPLESMSLSQFIKAVRQSPEAKEELKRMSNFGKGIAIAKQLKKEFKHKFICRVYRSAWNEGGNLVVSIELRGESYKSKVFSFNSSSSTRQPNYSFSTIFDGTIKPSDGSVEDEWGMGIIHGSYQSISGYDKFMADVVGVFKDYSRVNGVEFDMKVALKQFKDNDKILKQWLTAKTKILKQYEIAKANARKVHYDIKLREPFIETSKKTVYYKTDEPREIRHPDEYGERAERLMSTKEYDKYEKAQAKISDMIEKFCAKHGFQFTWAASW
tara:strand:- start:3473 stop:4369 length:897 start_codon:yes stop_codon:yes gene_type:complete